MSKEPENLEVLVDEELDRATDPEYAAVSPMAIFGLVLSVGGIAAFFVAPLVALPVVGLIVSLAAAQRIRRSEGVLTGLQLAQAGIAVGAALALASAAYHLETYREERQALHLVETKAYEAVDEIAQGQYEKVYLSMPEEFRNRQAPTAKDFGSQLAGVFKDAGAVKERNLLALVPIISKENRLLQRAQVSRRPRKTEPGVHSLVPAG